MLKKARVGNTLILHTDEEFTRACQEAFHFLNLPESCRGRDKIVIKPNLVSCRPYAAGSVSDPLVLDVLLDTLRECYDGEIVIAEAEAIFKTRLYHEHRILKGTPQELQEGFDLAFSNSGINDVLAKHRDARIRVLDVTRAEPAPPEAVRERVRDCFGTRASRLHRDYVGMIPREFLQGNILGINLAKFKTHDQRPTLVTLALKNIYGFTTPPDREHLHGDWHNPWRLVESIISMDLIYFSLFSDWLHIVEGLRYCMEGNGPNLGTTVHNWGKMAAGPDPVELDAVCASMMGRDPGKLPYLVQAARVMKNFDHEILAQIPPDFCREFVLNDKVIAWMEAEKKRRLSIYYLRLSGFLRNRFPGPARILAALTRPLRRILRDPRRQKSI
jgi:uncharacterized protein (DUF362 family)